jgi:hypothetical protein
LGHPLGKPKRWKAFGNEAPKSLFFSCDPVAIDSVMSDFMEAEQVSQGRPKFGANIRDYMVKAAALNMGIPETGNPWAKPAGSGYQRIGYIFVPI